jgi:hypothetical protein
MNMTAIFDIAPCSLVEEDRRFRGAYCLVMKAVRTSKTSVYFNETTRCHSPEGCHVQQNYLASLLLYSDHRPFLHKCDQMSVLNNNKDNNNNANNNNTSKRNTRKKDKKN